MDGEEVYDSWVRANELHSIGVSAWGELDAVDQAVWNQMAEDLFPYPDPMMED